MTAEIHPDGKILIVGGGIANFTNVAATFKVHFLKVTLAISYAIFSVLQKYSYKSVFSNKGIPCGPKNPCCFISREMKLNNAYFRELLEAFESTSRSWLKAMSVYMWGGPDRTTRRASGSWGNSVCKIVPLLILIFMTSFSLWEILFFVFLFFFFYVTWSHFIMRDYLFLHLMNNALRHIFTRRW